MILRLELEYISSISIKGNNIHHKKIDNLTRLYMTLQGSAIVLIAVDKYC